MLSLSSSKKENIDNLFTELDATLVLLLIAMSEKSRLSSRFHFYLIAISMFLVLSSVFLLQFSNSSLAPRPSVLKLARSNKTSFYLKPTAIEKKSVTDLTNEKTSDIVISQRTCDPTRALLRVYMYDLSPEFHFGLLGWKENRTWPEVSDPTRIPRYPGGLNRQHSVEYWLTLNLLSSTDLRMAGPRPCTAVRVADPRQADAVFVPFFASLSYNRHSKPRGGLDRKLQDKLLRFLKGRKEWRSRKCHIIVAHHPNSLLDARRELGPATFVLADFGRYPTELANVDKDVIAPYMHVVRSVPAGESPSFSDRPILAYFKGAIYRKDGGMIRQELFYLLREEKDVEFSFGSVGGDGIRRAGRGMASSKFCLHIAGDTPSSNRLFDAIATHCVPVIVSDDIQLPYEDVIDYSRFSIFVQSSDAVRKGYLMSLLRGVKEEKWTQMWDRLKEIGHFFEYQFPSRPGDAVDMIWEAVSRKIFDGGSENRYNRSRLWS